MNAEPQLPGKYRLRKLSGRASIVEVWDSLDTHSQLNVIIKLFRPNLVDDPDFAMRFEQEAQLIASLHHPNIVQVRDFQVVPGSQPTDKVAYLVMDAVAGIQLADYLRSTSSNKKFPPWEAVVQVFSSLCTAIDYAHQHGVIHRNINPTNILLNTQDTSHNSIGEPMLTDFGVTAILGINSSPRPGTLQGNPDYLAPERLQGYRGNELSDVYSLGVILYQICTGVLPFADGSENAKAVARQRTDTTPQPPGLFNPAIPPALTFVLLKSVTKDPSGRFPSATAMANAVAEALNIFIPDDSSALAAETMNLPTYLTIERSETLPELTPPVASQVQIEAALSPLNGSPQTPVLDNILATPPSTVAITNGQHVLSVSPKDSANQTVLRTPSDITELPTLAIAKSATLLPSPTKPHRRWRNFILIVIAIVVLLSGSIALAAFYGLPRTGTNGISPPGPAIVGHAFFLSSGHVSPNTNQGINDGLQVTLQHISAPPPGKNYYAWLLNDTNDIGVGSVTPVLLGPLAVVHGTATLTYKDKKYTNLLALFNRLVITEEGAGISPGDFPSDKSTWKYLAVLPETTHSTAKNGLLDHLRYLLSGEPALDNLGLRGGLTIWCVKNIEAITIWAGSARDYWNSGGPVAIRSQLIRILDVLDSAKYVQGDVPDGNTLEINVPVALLTLNAQSQTPQSFLYQIDSNLKAIVTARGATPAQIQLARKVRISLVNVTGWIAQVHKDAVQLLQESNAQLQSPASLSLLNDMATQALYAYVGQLNPVTNQVVPGATQIYDSIEHLVTFTITPYTVS